jgi:hypothetical protein
MSVDLSDDDGMERQVNEFIGGLPRLEPLDKEVGEPNGGLRTYQPGTSGWVIEVWLRPGHPKSNREARPSYWNGPPGCKASNLSMAVAVFGDPSLASDSFKTHCLPLPPNATKWEVVKVENADHSPYSGVHGWGGGQVIHRSGSL